MAGRRAGPGFEPQKMALTPPIWALSLVASHATTGVFPAPPLTRLPTEITGGAPGGGAIRWARARATAKEGLEGLAALSVSAQQSLAGVKIVQSTRAEAARAEDFERHNEAQRQVQLRATMAQLLPGPVIELIAAVAAGIVIAYGGREVFAGRLTPGELVAFLVAMGLMNLPLKGLSEVSLSLIHISEPTRPY